MSEEVKETQTNSEDTKVNELEKKAQEADNQRKSIIEGNNEIKEALIKSEQSNVELKSALVNMTEALNKKIESDEKLSTDYKEEIKSIKEQLENTREVKRDENVNISIPGSYEDEVKKISNRILKGMASSEEKDFINNDNFMNYVEKKALDMNFGDKTAANRMIDETKSAFRMRTSDNSVKIPIFETKAEPLNAVTSYRTSVGADGGFIMKTPTMRERIEKMYDNIEITMRDVANVMQITTPDYQGLVSYKTSEATWEPEERPNGEPLIKQFGTQSIKVGEEATRSKVTRQALEDTSRDIYSILQEQFLESFAQAEAKAFFLGDGSNNRPLGLFNKDKYGELDYKATEYEIDKLKTMVWDTTGGVNGLINSIIRLRYYLKNVKNKVIMMNPDTLIPLKLERLNNGEFLFDRLMPRQENGIELILGMPVVLDTNIPAMFDDEGKPIVSSDGKGVKGIFIGDIKNTYTILDRINVVTWVEATTSESYISYYGRKRVGGAIEFFNNGAFIRSDK